MSVPLLLARTLIFLAGASPLYADTIVGRVVDHNGNGVPGVDIDVTARSGSDPVIFNDGTDALGYFVTTVPAGLFDVSFRPPAPPASSSLPASVPDVFVLGTTDLGVITLEAGAMIAGQLFDESGFPVGGVTVDVIERPSGAKVPNNQNRSDTFGNFQVIAPLSEVDLELNTKTVVGASLVSQRLRLMPTGALDLGSLTLEAGFPLTGLLQTSGGLPVAGLDLDVFDATTGTKLYTPGDNTNTSGAFSILLPLGTYDLEVCPGAGTMLVARDFEGFVVSGPLDLGIVALEDGAILSGTVRDVAGTPLSGIDLDVVRSASAASVVTCGDDTNTSGFYSVVVPLDTLDVSFAQPGRHGTSAADLHAGLQISGNTALDGVLPAPLAGFDALTTSGLPPLMVDFVDTSSGAITSYAWNLGDGATSTAQAPQHVYAQPGSYTVELTVDGIGGPSTEARTGFIQVHEALVSAFGSDVREGPAPLLVRFDDLSTGAPSSWSWSFGDGTTSSLQNPSHQYSSSGTYTVSLTVSGPGGTSTHSEPSYVNVTDAAPVAGFFTSVISGTAPLDVAFTDTSTGTLTSWLWSFGDGTTSSLQHPGHVYASPGTYTVALVVSGPGGSSIHTEPGLVTVTEPPPRASFLSSVSAGTAPLDVAFTDTSTGTLTSWLWSFGDGTTSSLQHPGHVYASPGTYTVALIVTGPGGSDAYTAPDSIVVAPGLAADFVADRRHGRAPFRVSFTDLTVDSPSFWFWTFGDGATSSEPHPTHIYRKPGTYDVQLVVLTASGVEIIEKTGYIVVESRSIRRKHPGPGGTRPAPAPAPSVGSPSSSLPNSSRGR